MPKSISGQDELNPVLWLDTWAGKIPDMSCKKIVFLFHVINSLLAKLFRSCHDGRILASFFFLDSGFVLFSRVSGLTPSWSIITVKNNLANLKPSCPHTWSITHISCMYIALAYDSIFLCELNSQKIWLGSWTILNQTFHNHYQGDEIARNNLSFQDPIW